MSITILGLLSFLIQQLFTWTNVPFIPDNVNTFLQVLLGIITAIGVYWGRMRKGDLSWFGTRK